MDKHFNLGCILAALLLSGSAGCCSSTGRGCANGYASSTGASSQTIAPPATYSLQIPSAGGTTPYYVPGGATSTANLPAYLVDPNQRAPVPQTNQTGNQNGWRPVNGNNLSGTVPVNNAQPASNTPTPATIFANTNLNQNNLRTASATAFPGGGSVNYQTTRVDERLDPTRLPANDASNVRAPAQFVNSGNGTRLAQIQQPTQPLIYTGAPTVTGNVAAGGQPVFYGQAYASPFSTQGRPPVQSVLAQSTTVQAPGNSGGWRDREITASRDSMNR